MSVRMSYETSIGEPPAAVMLGSFAELASAGSVVSRDCSLVGSNWPELGSNHSARIDRRHG